MTVYPFEIDSDATIGRVDDNLTEIGGEIINQQRDAIFAIEKTLGKNPQGSVDSVAARLDTSLDAQGNIRASALTSVGLATLPIVDNQVAFNAGIKEYKLSLDYSTSNLHDLILGNTQLLNALQAFASSLSSDLSAHISGATLLSGGGNARHVLSQIDLNSIPFDSRDINYVWQGLHDKNGNLRSAATAAEALDQINTDLINHENATAGAHVASAIEVDTDLLQEIPTDATTVQKVIEYLDQTEVISLGEHRATQHANAIPPIARTNSFHDDGYNVGQNIVSSTPAKAFLIHIPYNVPVDDLSTGDDIIKFYPEEDNFTFDAQFSQVKIGDVITMNYGNGTEVSFLIDSLRYVPGSEWLVRINGTNLKDTDGYSDGYGSARIDRPTYDMMTAGILATAAANATPANSFSSILSSLIVSHPRAATALGLNFNPGAIDSDHYKLYLELYPTGNPVDRVISLPGIDITGNQGATRGAYTLESLVKATNNKFREIGFNYRFIVFSYQGEFGIKLADAIGGASFSIISGDASTGVLQTGAYLNNILGGNTLDEIDPLGFGSNKANIASPAYRATYLDPTDAQLPTKIIPPLKHRNFVVNGQRRDTFAPTYLALGDGYWKANLTSRTPVGIFTVEVSYTIDQDLSPAGLKIGKTLVVQPDIDFSDSRYLDIDYGRFIIKSVNFIKACGDTPAQTQITVINGLHGIGSGFATSSNPVLPVKIYYSFDSVDFDNENLIDQTPTVSNYHRFHEIYINQKGETFSHERARLPRQGEDSAPRLLGTDRWHLRNVSPKLRGYKDTDLVAANKYIRFYVVSYNSSTGEFDGYVGKRPLSTSTGIEKTGPLTTGKKNVPVRFYDETGLDYIELVYQETAAYPGSSVLSNSTSRFVDIELFNSLQLNDELLLLSTCEVNWRPNTNADIIDNLLDARQFGSIDEKDLTNSAITYLSAADATIHENGIISGFEYDSISGREVIFKGGVALVNGKIIPCNNLGVNIPLVYDVTDILLIEPMWAICVNEFSGLTPVLLTTTSRQFFASNGVTSYLITSVTFDELVNKRKDLTLIYLISAHSGSLSSSHIKDVRRFINNQGFDLPLLLSSKEYSGQFRTFDAVKNWISNSTTNDYLIKVRGNITLSSSFSLTGFTKKVKFEGENATITVNGDTGLILGSNIELNNLNFYYNPTTGSATNYVNTGSGCVYIGSSSDVSNVTISNCSFVCETTNSARPAFINAELIKGRIFSNLKFINNSFSDTDTSTMAAIAIINLNTGGSSLPAAIYNLIIRDNICNDEQGIYLTSQAVSSIVGTPGLTCVNSIIENNRCGIIGYFISGVDKGNSTINIAHLTIINNTCRYIGALSGNGKHVISTGQLFNYSYVTGNINLIKNNCHWLDVVMHSNSNIKSTTIIEGNNLRAWDPTFKQTYCPSNEVNNPIAIAVFDNKTAVDLSYAVIENNRIDYGYSNSITYNYYNLLSVYPSANINNNLLRGVISSSAITMVSLNHQHDDTQNRHWSVYNNHFYRGSSTILGFIGFGGYDPYAGSNDTYEQSADIHDNYFDSNTIDGYSSNTIYGAPVTWSIRDTINYSSSSYYAGEVGTITVNPVIYPCDSVAKVSPDAAVPIQFVYSDTSELVSFKWSIPFSELIPLNSYITSVSVEYRAESTISGTKNVILTAYTTLGTFINNTTLSDTTVHTLTLSDTTKSLKNNWNNRNYLTLVVNINSASTINVDINKITVNYRW